MMPRVDHLKRRFNIVVFAFVILATFNSAFAKATSHAAAARASRAEFAQFIRDFADAHHFNGSIRVEEDGRSLLREALA